MKPYMTKILGSDALGTKTLALLAAAWAPSTAATYGSTIRRYFDFCTEQRLAPLAATPAHMARYVAWLGQLGTIKASSLQPYLSAVNGFFKDHGLEAVALGDLVAKVRKGLAASQVAIDDTTVRVHLPAYIIEKALRMAQALRLQLTAATSRELLQASPAREQVRLLRACTTVVLLYLFFSRGGAGIGCLTEDLVASEADGLRLYHRTRKGQREVSAERKLLCHLPPTVHSEVVQMLLFFDAIRHTLSDGKYPTARWAISTSERHDRWTANTLTGWLSEVTMALQERPPEGYRWTSHSLRKGAATAAYSIGVTLQKIKHFGGWSTESSVVLDYIDPTALAGRSEWFFFGWLTPWGGQPTTNNPPNGDNMANGASPCFVNGHIEIIEV